MKITAEQLRQFDIIDEIVPEPPGGAHVDREALFRTFDRVLDAQLTELLAIPPAALTEARYQKFRRMGRLGREFIEVAPS